MHQAAWCHNPEDYNIILYWRGNLKPLPVLNYVLILKYCCLFQAERETRAFLKSSINKYYAAKEKDAVTLMWDYIMGSVCVFSSHITGH
jgi:hypothetical protein